MDAEAPRPCPAGAAAAPRVDDPPLPLDPFFPRDALEAAAPAAPADTVVGAAAAAAAAAPPPAAAAPPPAAAGAGAGVTWAGRLGGDASSSLSLAMTKLLWLSREVGVGGQGRPPQAAPNKPQQRNPCPPPHSTPRSHAWQEMDKNGKGRGSASEGRVAVSPPGVVIVDIHPRQL